MNRTPLILVAFTLLAMDVNVDTKEKLAVCRQKIDSIDQRIAQLIQDRARVVNEVRRIKKEAHLPVGASQPVY
jgi:chorismate mutase